MVISIYPIKQVGNIGKGDFVMNKTKTAFNQNMLETYCCFDYNNVVDRRFRMCCMNSDDCSTNL